MNQKDRFAAGRRRNSLKSTGSAGSDCASLFTLAIRHHQAGQLYEAEALYRRILEADRSHIGSLHRLGIIALQRGQPQAAVEMIARAIAIDDRIAECHYGMGCAHQMLGRLSEAVTHYERAIKLKPDYAEAHGNLGSTLGDQGLSDQAVSHYRRALELNPRFVEGYINLGCELLVQGKLDIAAAQFERALSLNPNMAEAHANLGDIFFARGQLEEAMQRYDRALALKPNLAELHNKIGVVLAARGDFAVAASRFKAALTIKPGLIEAYANLAGALLSIGKADEALGVVRHAIEIAETPALQLLFVQCVKSLRLLPEDHKFHALMVRALSAPWGRPNDLAPAAAKVLKQERPINICISRAVDSWPRRLPAEELFGADGLTAISQNRLLQCLLETTIIADIEIERFLTNARFALLQAAIAPDPSFTVDQNILGFYCALARYCFFNEYVFALTEEELGTAGLLRDQLASALASGTAVAELSLAAIAAYFPLRSLPHAESILDRHWSNEINGILTQQIREPAEEQRLKTSIPTLTPIENGISRLVQKQYEENPYPRWTRAHPPNKPVLVEQYLRKRFPAVALQNMDKNNIDVLIAGCGTGQQAIECASRFSGARVLAIDLSRASLAYAIRKTRELELHNIDYGQADILKLNAVGRAFDVIVSSGVLHHLDDPFAGWRSLLSLLRPGGFMEIGLYSEIARTNVVEARTFIGERGYASTSDEIRRCRQDLIALDGPMAKWLSASEDFYSVSGCRDLLFHVQERRLTIPQIEAFVAENNLDFLGFNLSAVDEGRYRAMFPADHAISDLASWEAFERAYPRTFSGMYQFWIQQKP